MDILYGCPSYIIEYGFETDHFAGGHNSVLAVQRELWRIDGTEVLLQDIWIGSQSSDPFKNQPRDPIENLKF